MNIVRLFQVLNNEVYLLAKNNVAKTIDFCSDVNVLKAIRIVGIVISIIKVLVPVVLVMIAIIKLAKVVVASEETSEAVKNVFQKMIIGILIFFIPALISVILSAVGGYNTTVNKFAKCNSCIFQPNTTCKKYIK